MAVVSCHRSHTSCLRYPAYLWNEDVFEVGHEIIQRNGQSVFEIPRIHTHVELKDEWILWTRCSQQFEAINLILKHITPARVFSNLEIGSSFH